MLKQLSSKEAGYAKNMNFFADKLKLFFALFFISFFSLEGFAQTVYTWTGSAGGTSWNYSGNWADGKVADISGSYEVKIVLENNVEISDDLTFNSSGSNQITIDTNGYNFECNRIILVDMVYNKASASVIFSGSGTLSTEILDFPNTGTHSLTVESGTTFKITSKFFGNVYNSSDKFEFKGNGTLYIPASGADLTYGQCGVFYDSTLTVLPIGTPTYFSISSDGKSIHPADSAEGLGITCSVTRNGGSDNVSFSYTAEALGGASLSDFLFKGAALTGSGEVIVQGSSNTETVHLKYNGSGLSAGDGVKLSFKTPDKSMIIAEIVWVEQSPVWTGNVSSDWGDSRNWSNGTVPGNNSEVVISSGCTNYPEITAAAFAKSVAIKSNASIVISGGSLKVESIICTGNSNMDISGGILKISSLIETKDFGCINSSGSGGTVEISGNCTFKAINPQRCEFFNIVTDSGSTFSIENDIYVLGNWTNHGNFDAQGHTVFFTGNSSDSSVTAGSSHFSGFVVKKDISVNDSVVIDGAAVFYKGVKSLSSGNFVFNGSVDCKNDVTLGCGFSFGTGSSFSAPAGNLYLKGNSDFSGCGSFSHNDGTIYFHGFTPADVRTLTTKDSQEFHNLNISGSVNLELNGAVKALTVYAGKASASPLDLVKVSGSPSGCALKIDCNFENYADFVIEDSVKFEVSGNFSGNGRFKASSSEMKFGGNIDFSSTEFDANGGTLTFAASDSNPKIFTAKSDGSTQLCNLSISAGTNVESSSSFSLSGNWNNENLAGGFKASAGTVNFSDSADSVSVKGNNEFYVLKFENSGTTVKTVRFDSGKIQKINGKIISLGNESGRIKLTSDAAAPSYSDSSTWWKIDLPSGNVPAQYEFTYTDVEYSESVNDIAHDWGSSVAESVEASTKNWFYRHFYWYGTIDTKWATPGNWSTNAASYAASSFFPPYLRGSSEITIAKNDTNVLTLEDSEYTVKNLTVSAGTSVDFNGKKISIADSLTNAGTIRLSGSETIDLPDWSNVSKVVQDDGSFIEYYGAMGGTLPWQTSCKNLKFADGAFSSVSGTGVVSAVSVEGSTLIENGSGNELILSGANDFSGGVKIAAAGRLTINAASELKIEANADCTSLTVISPAVLNGNVTTLENQVYEKDVTGTSGFVLDAGTGLIKFGRESVSAQIKITSTSDQVYKSPIKAYSGLIFDSASSAVKFEGSCSYIESSGNQIYKSTVQISQISLPATDSFAFKAAPSSAIQFCKGVETLSSENMAVSLDGDVYFSDSGTIGGSVSSVTCSGTVYFACSTDAQILNLKSPAKALNVVLLGGTLELGGNANTVEAVNDFVLLSGLSSVIYKDGDGTSGTSGRNDLFRYIRASSDSDSPDTADSSLNALPSAWPENLPGFPDGESTPFCAKIQGLEGRTLKAGKNFYANSVDLLASASWNLEIPSAENATDCFAELYNLEVSNCNASNDVSACEKCTDSGGNSKIDFIRPKLNVACTVFDDVIKLEFSESIENSNNEISKAVRKAFFYYNGSMDKAFEGSFVDADCSVSTDGQGDLQIFYVKAENKWNTDATGSSAGDSQSSDRSGVHSSAIPYVKMLKAAPTFFASLRDEHKNRLASKDFTDVADGAAPVLIAVSTGQELHSPYSQPVGEESQPPYDAHNFIELQYSEEVFVPGVAKDSVNIQSSASLGNVSGSSGLTVAGIARFSSGSISCGTNDGSDVESIHALYRNFATTRSDAMNYDSSYLNPQTHRLRISVAGFSGGTVVPQDSNTYRSWFGYIDSISSPESATVACIANPLITDNAAQPNAVDAVGTALHPLPVLYVNQRAFEHDSVLYGAWDTNPPSFACFRGKTEWTAMASSNECEVLGIGDEGATFINRMEFHLFDNKPSFSASDLAAWRSRVGWVSSFGEEGSVLTAARSYAADIFGGAKPFAFASDSDRATGGIRYSSLYNQASGFKYSAEDSDSFQSFASSEISPKVTINIFNDLNANRRVSTLGADGLYFSISMPPASRYSLRQTFTICYDDSAAFVTDLAGNRLRSATIKTIDITPPSFNFTLAPLGQNKLYILFSKKIAFTDSVLENISKNLELVKGNSLSAGLKIDENVPAKLCFSGNTATGFLLELNRNVTLDDVKKLYISVKNTGTGIDPITGLSANVSCIQDELGNYALVHSAHALSDFAVNAVQVNYAYDNRLIDEDGQPLPYSVSDGNWAARDFSAGQKNSGTLLSGHDISINANIYDGTQDNSGGFADSGVPVLFADNSPDAEALSTEINLNAQKNLRIWLPGLTSDVFKSFATANNSEFTEFVSGVLNGNSATFTLPVTREAQYNSWGGGNQISFIFALTDSSNEIVKIRHVPFYENENSYSEPGGVEYPLFAVRQVSSDISDIDLWSFRLKDEKLQRGGVSILNNVINANQGEKTTVQVDMAQDGNLNVVVVTLDGNIVTYLQHGRVSSGTHYYRWDGKNNSGNKVARGLYFIRVTGSGIDETRKVMVVKE